MVDNPFALCVVTTAVIALAYGLAAKSRLAERIGVTQIIIFTALVLGNLGVVPQTDDAYAVQPTYLVPISIALFLFRLDLQELRSLRKSHLFFFLFGSLSSICGGVVAYYIFHGRIGVHTAHLTGQLVASYIGGGENAVAVAQAVNVPHDLFTAAFAADNVVTAIWMMIGLSAPFGLSRFFSNEMPEAHIAAAKENSEPMTSTTLVPSIVLSLGLAGAILLAAQWIAAPIRAYAEVHQIEWLRFNTTIIWLTTLALLVAQTRIRRYLNAAYSMGTLLFCYFFFYMGAISSIREIAQRGPEIFLFVATIVGVHALLVLFVGRWLKLDLATIFVCSQANIGGPSTAVALAEANGWYHMITPGILLGILGYAIANYAGLLVAQLLP